MKNSSKILKILQIPQSFRNSLKISQSFRKSLKIPKNRPKNLEKSSSNSKKLWKLVKNPEKSWNLIVNFDQEITLWFHMEFDGQDRRESRSENPLWIVERTARSCEIPGESFSDPIHIGKRKLNWNSTSGQRPHFIINSGGWSKKRTVAMTAIDRRRRRRQVLSSLLN